MYGEYNCLPHRVLQGFICFSLKLQKVKIRIQPACCRCCSFARETVHSSLCNYPSCDISWRSKFLYNLEECTQSIKCRCFSLSVENLGNVCTFRVICSWNSGSDPPGCSYLMWNEDAPGSERRNLLSDESTWLEWKLFWFFFCFCLTGSYWSICLIFHLEHGLCSHPAIISHDGMARGCCRKLKGGWLFIGPLGQELRSCCFLLQKVALSGDVMKCGINTVRDIECYG